MKDGIENGPGTFASEREQIRGHLVENNTKREQVGAHVQFFAEHLFRRHIRDGSQSGPSLR